MYYVYFHQTIPLMFAPMLSVQMSLFVKLSYRCDMTPSKERSKKACELRSKVQLIQKWVFMMSIVSLFEKGTFIIKMYLWDFCPVHDICRLQTTGLPQTTDHRLQATYDRLQTDRGNSHDSIIINNIIPRTYILTHFIGSFPRGFSESVLH